MATYKQAWTAFRNHLRERGWRHTLKTLSQTKEPDAFGKLVGKDKFGNEYYENMNNIVGRQRWVVFTNSWKERNPSRVPAEWHIWLHHFQKETPIERPPTPIKYKLIHQATAASNMGAEANYLPPGFYRPDQVYDPTVVKNWRPPALAGDSKPAQPVVEQHPDHGEWDLLDKK